MPKRTNPLQSLVTQIERMLASEGVRVTASAMGEDAGSNSRRELDTIIEGDLNGTPVRIGIEVRNHRRKQTVEWIDCLIGKYIDQNVDVVLAVTKSGFTKAALRKASAHRIQTLTIEELEASKWPPGLFRPGMAAISHSIQVEGVRLHFDPQQGVPAAGFAEDAKMWEPERPDVRLAVGEVALKLLDGVAQQEIQKVLDGLTGKPMPTGRASFPTVVRFDGLSGRIEVADGSVATVIGMTLRVVHHLDFEKLKVQYARYKGKLVSVAHIERGTEEPVALVALSSPAEPNTLQFSVRSGPSKELPAI